MDEQTGLRYYAKLMELQRARGLRRRRPKKSPQTYFGYQRKKAPERYRSYQRHP